MSRRAAAARIRERRSRLPISFIRRSRPSSCRPRGMEMPNERRRISLLARSRVSCLRPAEQDLALLVEEIDDRVSDLELLPRTPFEEFLHVPQEGDLPSRGHLRRADNPLDHGMARAEREPKGISGLGTLSVQEPKRTQIHRTDSESGLAWRGM